ncbi:MAG: hypothetical protein V9G13_10145 [Marmoricola sp.]
MLIGDFAHDLLDYVFQGHHAGGSAVLVGDYGELKTLAAKQGEQEGQDAVILARSWPRP